MTKIMNKTLQHGSLFSPKITGRDSLKFEIPDDEAYHACRLTILETYFGGTAQLTSEPPAGKIERGEIVVSWRCERPALVTYQVEAFSKPMTAAGDTMPATKQMTSFSPSRNGWPFDNRFAAVPPFRLIGELKYGDASKGLCGGMVYAALDYYFAGLDIPTIPDKDLSKYKSPIQGPVFDYLSKRLFNSFDIPGGVLKYLELMHPDYPDYQSSRNRIGIMPRSRAWRTIRQEWPAIKAKLDTGQPCPLGLIRKKSTKLTDLGEHHQVLAYGYDLSGDELILWIYDPNEHHNDNMIMKLNIANPDRQLNIEYKGNKKVFCFFQTNYTFSMPPAGTATPGRIILFEDENFCGKSIDIVREHADLSAHKMGNFNNRTSSFVILSGEWIFYLNTGFDSPVLRKGTPLKLGPGIYRRVTDFGIQDNEITSLKAVKSTA